MKTLLITLWLLVASTSPGWGIEVGDPLPDFVIQSLEGKSISRTTVKGKPLLLVFWNTWCPDCRRELPEINKLAEQFGPKGLQVLAVNTAINDSESKTRAYWEKYGYVFPTGFDHYFEVGQAFSVRGVPTIFLIDAKGFVRYKHPRLPEDIEERFEQLTIKE
jgi:peroxiredoxin